MKVNIPTPAVVAAIIVLLLVVGVVFMKGASGESEAPKPDPARFQGGSPPGTPPPGR